MLSETQITVDGLPVQVYQAGMANERTLLLLHGEVGDARLHWTPVAPFLADEYRLIAPNLPAFGGTAPLREATLGALVRWTKALLETLQVEQAVVIGNSFGGLIARLFAAAHPQVTPAAIMVNGGLLPRTVSPLARLLARLPVIGTLALNAASRAMLNPKELGWLLANSDDVTEPFVEELKANIRGLAWTLRVAANSPIPEKRVPLVPTLLLWGADDTAATVEDAARLQGEIPGVQLALIENTRHSPHLDEPDVFSFQVTQFIDRLNRSSSSGLPGVGPLGNEKSG